MFSPQWFCWQRGRQAKELKIAIENACSGTRRPNFILFISVKVSSQWLEIQRNEKPSCFLHSPLGVFLGKTAHLAQSLHSAPLFPSPSMAAQITAQQGHFTQFLMDFIFDILRFPLGFWLFPLGESSGAGQMQCPGRRMCHPWQSHSRVTMGTGTVLQGHCPWWQQDISAPGYFIFCKCTSQAGAARGVWECSAGGTKS